jgi:hypothetical protein
VSSFSRRAFAPEFCQAIPESRLQKNEGRRSADRRNCPLAAPRRRALPLASASGAARATDDPLARTVRCGRARLSALRRGSRQALTPDAASGQASWDAGQAGVTRPRLSQSSGSTPRAGPSTGRHDAQSRPGAACETARGHRPRPAIRIASGCAPRLGEVCRPLSDLWGVSRKGQRSDARGWR